MPEFAVTEHRAAGGSSFLFDRSKANKTHAMGHGNCFTPLYLCTLFDTELTQDICRLVSSAVRRKYISACLIARKYPGVVRKVVVKAV
jgi:hypothetical protein